MCWFKMPKVQGLSGAMRATDLARTPAQDAPKPDAPVYGGTAVLHNKKRGVSALRIEDPIKKDRAMGVSRNYSSSSLNL